MFSRLNQDKHGAVLPREWIEEVDQLVESVYFDKLKVKNRKASTYGELFENEIVLIIYNL